MSRLTSTPVEEATTSPTNAALRLTAVRLVRSEVLRFVTVRANVLTLAALALLMLAIGAVAAATATGEVQGVAPGGGPAPGFAGADPLATVLAGQTPGVLVVGVLGVLIGAREYGSAMIRTTMTAAPRRLGVLLARLAAFVGIVGPVLILSTVFAWFVGTAILDAGGAPVAQWSEPGVPRAVIGTALYLTGIGTLGVCLGVLSRSIGQGIGWLVAVVLVIPGFGSLLLPDDAEKVLQYLPSTAGAAFTTVTSAANQLEPGPGSIVFSAWVLAAFLATSVSLRRRDV